MTNSSIPYLDNSLPKPLFLTPPKGTLGFEIDMYMKYHDGGLGVLGVATAFEDFDKNTLENLKLFLTTGEVIGAPRRVLGEYGRLALGNKLGYKIPFPVGMDTLLKIGPLTDDKVMDFIEANITDFKSYTEKDKESIYAQVQQYLKRKQFRQRLLTIMVYVAHHLLS